MEHYNSESREIVLEYLLHYCHKDSAKAFLKETKQLDSISATDNNNFHNKIDWKQIETRKEIYELIKTGDIKRAITLLEHHFPTIMTNYSSTNVPGDSAHFVVYKLYCQEFIEMIRLSGVFEAIQFARVHLYPFFEHYTEYANSIIVLIAYEDLEHERVKFIMSQDHRNEIADQINRLILETRKMSHQTTLEKLWRQSKAIQSELGVRQEDLSLKKNDSKYCEKLSI